MNLRRFADAAHAYAQAAAVDPNDLQSKNMLGYAEGLAGDMDAARKAFEEYGRAPDAAENALDSLGEAYFINGKFPDAEKAFLQAYQKNPAFLVGQPLRKAAYAHWLGGDLPGADGMMDRYFKATPAAKDPLVLWRKAGWLYETGRKDQAIAALRQASGEVATRQLAVWQAGAAPTDLAALKSSYERADPLKDGLARTFYAAALVNAGQKAQAKQLLARWPLPDDDDNLLASLMFPEFQRLRDQLR